MWCLIAAHMFYNLRTKSDQTETNYTFAFQVTFVLLHYEIIYTADRSMIRLCLSTTTKQLTVCYPFV